MNLYSFLKEKFENGEYDLISEKEILKKLGFSSLFEKGELKKILLDLENDAILSKDSSKRYALVEKFGLIKGEIKGNERGFAFLLPEDKKINDFFIPNRSLNGAMHKDIVLARKCNSQSGSSDEAEVVTILSRGLKQLVGVYYAEKTYGFVVPDDKNYFCDIFVPFKMTKNAKTGEKVLVTITDYPKERKNPEGAILEVLGERYTKEAEEQSVIKTFGLPEEFSEKVLRQAQKVSNEKVSLENRKDLRNILTITIDGEDAKDLDDAISITKLDNKNYRLYVHIADVSHYVAQGDALDKEAYDRGTSVYFPNLVIPMLPKELSNGICSLNENEDRLTLTAIMEVNKDGDVVNKEICESVINSNCRMTYTAVTNIIEGDSEYLNKYSDILELVTNMKDLAKILIAKRNRRGSIDLDMKEAYITLDENEKVSISEYKRTISNRIIEEFMILANETVAEYMFYLEMPFIYRIHEKPLEEKLENFYNYIKELGIKVKWNTSNVHSKDFQNVLESLNESPLFPVVNRVMLRSMQKARYYPENLGHFGLSSSCYCHFTSPIRRYPDLVIHRIIKLVINGQIGEANEFYTNFVFDAAEQSSLRERKADEAERVIDDLYKVKYMRDHIGEEFDGIVSGVMSFGVFVELDNTIEGLIKIDTMPKGKYDYDEKRFILKSKDLSFKLGESVKIKVVASDMASRKIEFVFIEKTLQK